MRAVFGAMAGIGLSGCLAAQHAPDTCGAGQAQYLIGQPQEVLQTVRFSQPVRVIAAGDAVTMDYAENRLNIDIGAGGAVESLWCG